MDILEFIQFILFPYIHSNQQVWTFCCSITQSCPTLWDPMDSDTPDFPLSFTISQNLLKLLSTELMMPSSHLVLCHPLLLLPSVSPSIRVFPMYWLFASDGQSIGASASTSILPMNIQVWFLLGLTGLISLLSKRLSRVFPTPQLESINSLALSLLSGSVLTSIHDYWKIHSFDYTNLSWQSDVSAF